ncbi:MAG: glycosyltransferase family 4 protein [Gemmatimonadales bacterium]|nr:glycosyltransferase family 4 protein [Gemmatimonadales bacterium]
MTPRRRIVYVWDADYPWDVRTEKVCNSLTAAGHEVHLVARNRRWAAPRVELPEGTVHRMEPWSALGRRADGALSFPAFFNPRWIGLIDRVVRSTKADLIIARDLPLCPTALWVGRRRGVPVLFDMAENYPALLEDIWATGRARPLDWLVRNPSLARRVERYVTRRVDRTLVVIEEAAGHLVQLGVPQSSIHVVSNTPPRDRARDPDTRRTIDIAYLGIMEFARGLDLLIDALGRLASAGIHPRTRLIGGGRDLEELRRRAESRGLQPGMMEFTGFVPDHRDALAMMGEARIGVLPHLVNDWARTTIPNKLFDYMAAGMAVLSSDAPPVKRILDETGAGRTFRAGAAEDLFVVLREMLADQAALDRFGRKGRQAIADRYNWEADTAELLRAVDLTVGPR